MTVDKVVHEGLRSCIKDALGSPLRYRSDLYALWDADRSTICMRLSLATFPVNSAATLPGIPQVLWQASICWDTSGFVGATNTTFPWGNQW